MGKTNPLARLITPLRLHLRSAGDWLGLSLSRTLEWIVNHLRQEEAVALFSVYAATLLGGFVRLGYALVDVDFPLGDGGLFYQMSREVLAANFTIPKYTAYNASNIPFAYPPLAFFVAAFLSRISGWSLLRIFSLMPALVSILTIPAAHRLMRRLLRSEAEAAIAVLAFALSPRSMSWIIIGGGVARAPGVLFAVLALSEGYLLFTTRRPARVFSTAILASLAVLSHTEWGWFTFFSLALMFIFYGLNWKALFQSVLTVALVLLFTAPWWGTVVATHGLSPLVNAFATGEAGQYLFKEFFFVAFNLTHEPMLGVLAVLGVVGFFVCLAERRWFLAAWLVTMFLVHNRNAGTESIVPLSMMVAVCVHRLIVPGLLRSGEADHPHPASARPPSAAPLRPYAAALPAVLFGLSVVGYAFYGALTAARHPAVPLRRLETQDRDAMQWIAANTPEDSRFLVLNEAITWHIDFLSEWFPALTGRASLATVQGTEWLPDDRYRQSAERYAQLQDCAQVGSTACLEAWAGQGDVEFTHVYVAPAVQGALAAALLADTDYRLVYRDRGVTIFERDGGDE